MSRLMSSSSTPFQWLSTSSALLRWLTEPGSALPAPQRRRARLLAWIILALILLVIVAIILTIIFNPADSPRRGAYLALGIGAILALSVPFILNRAGHYTGAARLTILFAVLGPWVSVILDQSILNGDFVPLTYVALPILLCSILLSARTTILLAIVQVTLLGLLLITNPFADAIDAPSLIAFVIFLSVLSIVANLVNRRDLDQIDEQTRQLTDHAILLREQSVRDPLTGLFNRRYLEEMLAHELHRARAPIGVIMIDLDHFKECNDTCGHGFGDELLRQVALILRQHLRESDITCRYGGDEFTIILPDAPRATIVERAEHLRAQVKLLNAQYEGQCPQPITLSLGIAIFPDHGDTGEALLKASDAALYRAKRDGGDHVVCAGQL